MEKPTASAEGSTDEQKVPSGVMVNAEGEYVVAEPDKASWEQYQAKANRSALAQQEAAVGSKELQDRGLECSIDKRLFVDPVKTPCCQTTYCNDCITNTLLDENLQCPSCGKDEVSIDDLKPDEDMVAKIRSYTEEKSKEAKLEAEKAKSAMKKSLSPAAQDKSTTDQEIDSSGHKSRSQSPHQKTDRDSSGSPASKKRKAEDELENNRNTPAPATDKEASEQAFAKMPPKGPKADVQKGPQFPPELDFMNQPPFANSTSGNSMSNMNAFQSPNMVNPMMMQMMNNPAMWNPMMVGGMNGINGMNQTNGMSGINQTNGMNGMNRPNGMNPMGNTWDGMNASMSNNMFNQANNTYGMGGQRGTNDKNSDKNPDKKTKTHKKKGNNMRGRGGFNPRNFNSRPANEDSPYFRQPVNPGRHQARRNVQRPADYREI